MALGSFCIVDTKPRQFSKKEQHLLKTLPMGEVVAEAVGMASAAPPARIITVINLPGMDGIEALQSSKKA